MRGCSTGRAALHDLVEAELAFALAARGSVREAFLGYLAERALLLEPRIEPGRAFYQSTPDNGGPLTWHPTVADAAASGDLGFTTGPWVAAAPAPGGAPAHGHYVTVWTRDVDCRWRVQVDGGVSDPQSAPAEVPLDPERALLSTDRPPPQKFIAAGGAAPAIAEFRAAVEDDGLAAALRTYARNGDFRFYLDHRPPFVGVDPANDYLMAHPLKAATREHSQDHSQDSTFAYSVGELLDSKQQPSHSYLQVWQYAPQVANWGVRILLLNALPRIS